jgi:hypothetical protein
VRNIIRNVSGHGPEILKQIPGKVIAVTQSLASVKLYQEAGFTFVTESKLATDRLSIITNLKFRVSQETQEATVVALSEVMLHSVTSKFSHRFRNSSPNRMVLARTIQPEKTWPIFRNLGIHREAFGSQEAWLREFAIYQLHYRGFPMIRGMKNLDALVERIRPYVQEIQP